MLETTIAINFISDWHVGSGMGNGAIADAILNRNIHGIPVIPGSALKGALREGAWRLAMCDRENLAWLVEYVFGTASYTRETNRPGIIAVGEGLLPEDLGDWLTECDEAARQDFVGDMTILRQQTQLDSHGIAKDHSLRSIECGIAGLAFSASVILYVARGSEEWFKNWLLAVCACVKSIGADRARGLGRCVIRPDYAGEIKMPGKLPEALTAIRENWESK